MALVFLIEDEPWFGELYANLLGKEHEVQWHPSPYSAMDQIDRKPDLIVLDLMTPAVNGLQFLHELASYPDTAQIPVVLFSAALPAELDGTVLKSYGVVAALDKTAVKPHQVIDVVNYVLKNNPSTDANVPN